MISRHLTSILRNHGRISKGALRLERSSSTNSREINPPVSTECRVLLSRFHCSFQAIYSSKKVVVTLDPRKFAEKKQRRFHIGDTRGFKPFVALHNQSNPVRVLDLRFFQDRRWLPYPPDTTAFLYFFMPPKKPRIAGELRLRVASSDDHASFESGSDLLKLDGQPWSRSLYNVSKYYTPLYEKLREEGFVPNDLDAVLSTFPKKKVTKCQSHSSLNDTFIVDFSRIEKTITIISEQGMGSIRFTKAFEENRTTRMSPYTGAYVNDHHSIDILINL